ncbi:hypothetical protein B0I72DRAFT_140793 [Yarrowia lipolytica]|uniref:Proteasome assembly chaperone 1 n=1 Tax=Yarrowia lipolytica TaxID=4952 RepID=A0A371C2T0_YARLL|nr:Hypothetical protein YALI2_D00342g [Yarrowia lipolytica]RDW24637.1 hypothetical protein B0I71DRAFT_133906 [Yarrowia lipolytica]RDW30861.1 hypothetical protein B0I72DRAFT_140793 [Yarrowia lipolytica]RDW38834.1 hypothetical protein B0I73DRAFT_133033 [Yarrowia lipolytica]RDW44701.1 hypothetical protein B0I74DRAFT_140060 [Yarrowia lipolytica]
MQLKPWLQVNSPRHIIEEGHEEGFEDGQEASPYTKSVLFANSLTRPTSPQTLLVSTAKLFPVVEALFTQKSKPINLGEIVGEIQLKKNAQSAENRRKFTTDFLEEEDEEDELEDVTKELITSHKVILSPVQYGDVVLVEIKQDELLLAHGFAQQLVDLIKPCQALILAPGNTIADVHVHQLDVGKSNLVPLASTPLLQSPNFISGLGAAVLTRCQQSQVPATALVVQNVGTQSFERYQSDTFEDLTGILAGVFGLDAAKALKELRADDGVAGLYL